MWMYTQTGVLVNLDYLSLIYLREDTDVNGKPRWQIIGRPNKKAHEYEEHLLWKLDSWDKAQEAIKFLCKSMSAVSA